MFLGPRVLEFLNKKGFDGFWNPALPKPTARPTGHWNLLPAPKEPAAHSGLRAGALGLSKNRGTQNAMVEMKDVSREGYTVYFISRQIQFFSGSLPVSLSRCPMCSIISSPIVTCVIHWAPAKRKGRSQRHRVSHFQSLNSHPHARGTGTISVVWPLWLPPEEQRLWPLTIMKWIVAPINEGYTSLLTDLKLWKGPHNDSWWVG